jgi:hypothetical protein
VPAISHVASKKWVLPPREIQDFRGPAPTFKILSKPSALAMTSQGVVKRWRFFGPKAPAVFKDAERHQGATCTACLRLVGGLQSSYDAFEPSPPFAPWGLRYDFGASESLET